MLIAIDIGHNCPPRDIGAVGIKRQCDLNQEVGMKLIEKLATAGHEIILCTPESARGIRESLNKRCWIANNADADYF